MCTYTQAPFVRSGPTNSFIFVLSILVDSERASGNLYPFLAGIHINKLKGTEVIGEV